MTKVNPAKKIYIFLGPPGSGKGSLSQLCVKRLGWTQLSTGNLCREHIARKSEIGKQIDFAIKSGKLISDSLIIDMVDGWLRSNLEQQPSVILDGFPRTTIQAGALNELLQLPDYQSIGITIIKILIQDTEVVNRLSARYICANNRCQLVYSLCENSSQRPKNHLVCDECLGCLIRRPDDEEVAIKDRLLTYHKHEQELLDFYSSMGLSIVHLQGAMPLEQVYNQFLSVIGLH